MSVEEDNKAVFLEFFNRAWSTGAPEQGWIEEIRRSFPDLVVTPDTVLAAEGGHVVIMFTGTGTHQGDYKELPATGETVTFRGITVCRLENGKMVDEFACLDQAGHGLKLFM